MPIDLDAAIRERLRQVENDPEYGNESAVGLLIEAIEAALAEHKPHLDDPEKCSCIEYDDVYVANNYPCRTKRAIAVKLGIAVDDA